MILHETSINPKKLDCLSVVVAYLVLMGLDLSSDKESLNPSSWDQPSDPELVAYYGTSSVTNPKLLKQLMEELREFCHTVSGGYRFCWTLNKVPRETFASTMTLNITIFVSEVKKLKNKSLPKDYTLPTRIAEWLKNAPVAQSSEDCYKGM